MKVFIWWKCDFLNQVINWKATKSEFHEVAAKSTRQNPQVRLTSKYNTKNVFDSYKYSKVLGIDLDRNYEVIMEKPRISNRFFKNVLQKMVSQLDLEAQRKLFGSVCSPYTKYRFHRVDVRLPCTEQRQPGIDHHCALTKTQTGMDGQGVQGPDAGTPSAPDPFTPGGT